MRAQGLVWKEGYNGEGMFKLANVARVRSASIKECSRSKRKHLYTRIYADSSTRVVRKVRDRSEK